MLYPRLFSIGRRKIPVFSEYDLFERLRLYNRVAKCMISAHAIYGFFGDIPIKEYMVLEYYVIKSKDKNLLKDFQIILYDGDYYWGIESVLGKEGEVGELYLPYPSTYYGNNKVEVLKNEGNDPMVIFKSS